MDDKIKWNLFELTYFPTFVAIQTRECAIVLYFATTLTLLTGRNSVKKKEIFCTIQTFCWSLGVLRTQTIHKICECRENVIVEWDEDFAESKVCEQERFFSQVNECRNACTFAFWCAVSNKR